MRKWTLLLAVFGMIGLPACQTAKPDKMEAEQVSDAQEIKNEFELTEDVVWASPDGFDLTMDIYTPKTGKDSYPVLVIFHGGGWLVNNKSVMNDMSKYVVEHGEYVVCNVNYRLLVDQENTVKMNQIIEDVLGAVVWVQSNIVAYKGDPENIAVTGDSAGGHLAESVLTLGQNLGDLGFEEETLVFKPSYLPEGVSASDLKAKGGIEVQAAVISYGAFDIYSSCLGGFEKPSNFFWMFAQAEPRSIFGGEINAEINADMYQAVSPIFNIPEASERKLPPQLFTVGSKDELTTPKLVSEYVDKLKAAGQPASYWVHEGRNHAFMDSGANPQLGSNFVDDAIPVLDQQIIPFLDSVFYPSNE